MSNWTENKSGDVSAPNYDPSTHQFKKGWIDGHPRGGYPANYFFADTIRAVMIGFGNFFSSLYVIRYDEKGEPIKQIQVPLKYGPRMKSHDFRVEQESGKKYYITLPNLTYRKTGMSFASERYSGAGETRGFYSKYFEVNGVDYLMANKFWSDVHPVPYDITVSMEAKCEHISDANQIEEQILSRFAPEAYIDLKEFWFINKRRSIKMKLNSISEDITQDFGEDAKREITVSMEFTIEAWLYKPIEDTYIIDEIVTQLGVNGDRAHWKERMLGNYTGDFQERHDLDYQFGTKIGRVSALLPNEGQPDPVYTTTGWYQEYRYEETQDVTNYPAGSKLLVSQTICNDSDGAIWNPIDSALSASAGNVAVAWNDTTTYRSDAPYTQYWQVTANKDDYLHPTLSGDRIYQIWHDPDYVVSAGSGAHLNDDGGWEYDTPGVFRWDVHKGIRELERVR